MVQINISSHLYKTILSQVPIDVRSDFKIQWKLFITKLLGTEKLVLYIQTSLYQGSKNNKLQKKLT